MTNLSTEEQVGAHHCTPESIAALLADLDAIGECREQPALWDRDHRAQAGVVACVIRHLQGVGVRLALEKFNLRGELRAARASVAKAADADCVCVDGPQRCKYCAPHRALLDRIDEALALPAETPAPHGISPEAAALGRVVERHIRWREKAMGFLQQVIDGRGSEDEWPALAEFLERSNARMSESSPEKTSRDDVSGDA